MSMERLTEEKQLGPFASLKDKAEAKPGAFRDYDCLYAHMTAVTRLKAYEDTGLEPEEIKQMCALARLNSNIFDNDFGNHIAELIVAEQDGQLYTVHDVAVILASAIGDDCACNINSNDEWLPQLCELQEACPEPVGVACWGQYLKHHAEAEKALRKWAQS